MDSKTVDQQVIWRAGQPQVFNRPPDTIHLTTPLWQPMGELSYNLSATATRIPFVNIGLLPAKGVDNRKIGIYHVMSFIAIFQIIRLQLRASEGLMNMEIQPTYFYRFVFWQQQRRVLYPFDWACLRFLFLSLVKLAKQNYPPNSVNVEKLENAQKKRRTKRKRSGRKRFSG
jgi:hypothetical protein